MIAIEAIAATFGIENQANYLNTSSQIHILQFISIKITSYNINNEELKASTLD